MALAVESEKQVETDAAEEIAVNRAKKRKNPHSYMEEQSIPSTSKSNNEVLSKLSKKNVKIEEEYEEDYQDGNYTVQNENYTAQATQELQTPTILTVQDVPRINFIDFQNLPPWVEDLKTFISNQMENLYGRVIGALADSNTETQQMLNETCRKIGVAAADDAETLKYTFPIKDKESFDSFLVDLEKESFYKEMVSIQYWYKFTRFKKNARKFDHNFRCFSYKLNLKCETKILLNFT
jgi:hypothetical protein